MLKICIIFSVCWIHCKSLDIPESRCSVGRNQETGIISASCNLACLSAILGERTLLHGVRDLLVRVRRKDCRPTMDLREFTGHFRGLRTLRIMSPVCEFTAPLQLEETSLQSLELIDDFGKSKHKLDQQNSADNGLQTLWIKGECNGHINKSYQLPNLLSLGLQPRIYFTIEGTPRTNQGIVFVTPKLRILDLYVWNMDTTTIRNLPKLEKLHLVVINCTQNKETESLSNLANLQFFEFSMSKQCSIPEGKCKMNARNLSSVRLTGDLSIMNSCAGIVQLPPNISQTFTKPPPYPDGYLTLEHHLDDKLEKEEDALLAPIPPSFTIYCVSEEEIFDVRPMSFKSIHALLEYCPNWDLVAFLSLFPVAARVDLRLNDVTHDDGQRMYAIVKQYEHFTVQTISKDSGNSRRVLQQLKSRLNKDPGARLRPENFKFSSNISHLRSAKIECISIAITLLIFCTWF
ncbi:hypothetical protein Ciccas_006917 [Cichlidogyrus casuarinus]|uniref:Uncharacterized protein n=1 Tax=Cichlidogyrus casuarinus TaxID=1844966 RepID=A0ABD2Q4C1_9PLAT